MFYSLFARRVKDNPSKIAVINEGRTITYGEMDHYITRVAQNLSVIGVSKDTLLTACFDNNIEYLVLYYAVARLGATIAPLTKTLTVEDVERYCAECKPDFYFVESSYVETYQTVQARIGTGTVISEATSPHNFDDVFRAENPDVSLPTETWQDQDFVIQYTSGTTGAPKGIVQTQESHTHRMLTWAKTGNLTADDKTLCMLSLTHAYGADIITFPALSMGQTLCLLSLDNATPETVLSTIEKEKITIFGSLPWFYKEMVELPGEATYDLSSLRIAMCGATPLSQEIAQGFLKRFGVRINNSYGLTETCLITSNLFRTTEDLLSIGPLIEGVEAKLEDCGVGIEGAGELCVRSAAFADRYYSPKAGPLWHEDKYIHTGDLVRMDENRNVYILARVAEVIAVGDKKVLPFEVEATIEQLPEIKDVAVIPVEDGAGATKVGAFVVLRDELSTDAIRTHLENNLDSYKVPTYIQIEDEFPKSVTGKISKAKLQLRL
ncbi:MAG: long-chain fatty acid--CoA ligase [Haliangiales bacterium]